MSTTQFNRPILRAVAGGERELEVSGPFTLEFDPAQLQGEVTIRFLLIQEVPGSAPVVVDGVTGWSGGDAWRKTFAPGTFDARLRASPAGSSGTEGLCRGIGQAIVIRKLPGEDPPFFDSVTWCVTTEVVAA
ncbi:MAG TPA: hypothetical protein VFB42_03455 [Gaiellaceae bacterium]|nr:hypothetical protein [Gaiellaceae bacterium]